MQGVLAGSGQRASGASANHQSRVLFASVSVSVALHATLLAVHFKYPEALRWDSANAGLEVVLVNAKTAEAPTQATVLAQTNLDRGGNTDADLQASTPLPVTDPNQPGQNLVEAERRVRELEAQQRKLLTQASKPARKVAPPEPPRTPRQEQPAPKVSGRDLADLSLQTLQLQAQIDRQLQEYQKRPRKKFLGARAKEYRFAQYEEDWRMKVERIGTLNFPADATGKLYGSLRLTVTIRPDGSIQSVELDRSSGLKVLDAAAFRIVRLASPFAPFPPEIRKDTDLLVITRTWFFGKGDRFWMKGG